MASKNGRALYIGVTNSLVLRVSEHKNQDAEGFTKRYDCINRIYFESASTAQEAIEPGKQLKKWDRTKKSALINKENTQWCDLSLGWD